MADELKMPAIEFEVDMKMDSQPTQIDYSAEIIQNDMDPLLFLYPIDYLCPYMLTQDHPIHVLYNKILNSDSNCGTPSQLEHTILAQRS